MRYLVDWWGATGELVLEDTRYENEGSGTNMELARVSGSGTVFLNRAGDGSDIDNTGCTILTTFRSSERLLCFSDHMEICFSGRIGLRSTSSPFATAIF